MGLNCLFGEKVLEKIDGRVNGLIEKYTTDTDFYVGCVCWAEKRILHKRCEVFNQNGKMDRKKALFENKEFYIPRNYDSILKNSYGDYMKLPPEDKRKPSHDYIIIRR